MIPIYRLTDLSILERLSSWQVSFVHSVNLDFKTDNTTHQFFSASRIAKQTK